jgi:hypothetical protein
MDSLQDCTACVEPLAVLSLFRLDLHASLGARCDGLFDLRDRVRGTEFLKGRAIALRNYL